MEQVTCKDILLSGCVIELNRRWTVIAEGPSRRSKYDLLAVYDAERSRQCVAFRLEAGLVDICPSVVGFGV